MSNKLFSEAEKALIAGDYKKGKKLLSRLIREDKTNDTYWYYLSATVNTKKEQIQCLQRTLKLNPNHDGAKQGLILLGAVPPEENIKYSTPPTSKGWEISPKIHAEAIEEAETEKPFFEGLITSKFKSNGAFVAVLAIFILIGSIAGWFSWDKGYLLPSEIDAPLTILEGTQTPTPSPTNTPTPTITPSPTPTLTPTLTPIVTYSGPTFTPTPNYVGTPHPESDSYISGMESFADSSWLEAIAYFNIHLSSHPDDADVMFYRGLAYLNNNDILTAKSIFSEITNNRPDFAPGYYGYALARLTQDPTNDVLYYLDNAILNDNQYLEAYILRAQHFMNIDENVKAYQDANRALELAPDNAIAMQLLASTYLANQDYQTAYELIEQALIIDPTYIPSYGVLGNSLVGLNRPVDAERPLEIYLLGYPEDALATMNYGVVLQTSGDHHTAIVMFDRAKEFDPDLWKTVYHRGVSYLAVGEYMNALSDLVLANEIYDEMFKSYLYLSIGYYEIDDHATAMQIIQDGRGFAQTEEDLAAVYYWRAKYSDAGGNVEYAITNYDSLLNIQDQFVTEGWKEEAQDYIDSH